MKDSDDGETVGYSEDLRFLIDFRDLMFRYPHVYLDPTFDDEMRDMVISIMLYDRSEIGWEHELEEISFKSLSVLIKSLQKRMGLENKLSTDSKEDDST